MRPPLPDDFLTVPLAHRALHDVTDGRPENSRAAIRAAIAVGYGIEIDVQLSADDQALVFHDDNLDRLARASGPVRAQSGDRLTATELKGGDGEGIPTLAEILALVDGRVPLLVEIKDQDGAMGPGIGPLERAVARGLAGYAGPVAVMSFNPYSVAKMAALLPDVPRGLVTSCYDPTDWRLDPQVCARLRDIPDYDEAACSFISHEWQDLSRPRVQALKSAGAHILCWTIKSPADEAQARRIAENITFEQYRAPLNA
ncbi:glycerophosphodiester phosphodiesterase family protein [Roseobacter ponti]|uniref:Phosphodiesterase n=1 Tax=Roseobacter ponti TaxID=1891787 RepID=A0A858SZ87_9RHOB|nr:glycerophosphodiester phosphodiesterase family protein [Roseobacter ponti]QJF52811.1 phosphodiesterase [Roseobacter ponti]